MGSTAGDGIATSIHKEVDALLHYCRQHPTFPLHLGTSHSGDHAEEKKQFSKPKSREQTITDCAAWKFRNRSTGASPGRPALDMRRGANTRAILHLPNSMGAPTLLQECPCTSESSTCSRIRSEMRHLLRSKLCPSRLLSTWAGNWQLPIQL